MTVCTEAGSILSQLNFDPSKELCTHSIANECDDLPVLMREGGKVKLCVPRVALFSYETKLLLRWLSENGCNVLYYAKFGRLPRVCARNAFLAAT